MQEKEFNGTDKVGEEESFRTNPLGLTEFYTGEVPPWDESLGEFSWEV